MPTFKIIEKSHVAIKMISQRGSPTRQITTDVKLRRNSPLKLHRNSKRKLKWGVGVEEKQ